MEINYAVTVSPIPLKVNGIGTIKSPTLRSIWELDPTCHMYTSYLSLLSINAKIYCEKINPKHYMWYDSLSDEAKKETTIFDVINLDKALQKQFELILDFFFVENIIWDDQSHVFYVYITQNENRQVAPMGVISKDTWAETCDLILKMNGVKNKEPKKLKFKNEAAREVWELTHDDNDEKHNGVDDLANIVSSVAAKDKSLNMLNIWGLTVCQLYDQFKRHQVNSFYDISAMSVAAYGDEKNHFDSGAWYENIYNN